MLPNPPCTLIKGLTSSSRETASTLTSSQPFLASFPYYIGEGGRILK